MKGSFAYLLPCLLLLATLASFSVRPVADLPAEIFSETNQFRVGEGLPPLLAQKELDAIAQEHSENMASGRVAFGHDGFEGRSVQAKKKIATLVAFAENVAYGAKTASEVMTMWKNSPAHRQNILGKYQYIGIGVAADRQGKLYYTQVFVADKR